MPGKHRSTQPIKHHPGPAGAGPSGPAFGGLPDRWPRTILLGAAALLAVFVLAASLLVLVMDG
jgi:hypothetical protein